MVDFTFYQRRKQVIDSIQDRHGLLNVKKVLSLHRALLNLYIVHSPTDALFIKPGKVYIYMKIHIIIVPTCFGLRSSSACTEPG